MYMIDKHLESAKFRLCLVNRESAAADIQQWTRLGSNLYVG